MSPPLSHSIIDNLNGDNLAYTTLSIPQNLDAGTDATFSGISADELLGTKLTISGGQIVDMLSFKTVAGAPNIGDVDADLGNCILYVNTGGTSEILAHFAGEFGTIPLVVTFEASYRRSPRHLIPSPPCNICSAIFSSPRRFRAKSNRTSRSSSPISHRLRRLSRRSR